MRPLLRFAPLIALLHLSCQGPANLPVSDKNPGRGSDLRIGISQAEPDERRQGGPLDHAEMAASAGRIWISNAAESAWRDVTLSVTCISSDGVAEEAEKRFVGYWEPGKRIRATCLLPEKILVDLETGQNRKKARFAYYTSGEVFRVGDNGELIPMESADRREGSRP